MDTDQIGHVRSALLGAKQRLEALAKVVGEGGIQEGVDAGVERVDEHDDELYLVGCHD